MAAKDRTAKDKNTDWRRCVLFGAAAALLTAGTARAQTERPAAARPPADRQIRRFDLPKQPLSKTIISIGVQSGVDIAFDPASVRGEWAPALRGDFTVEEALARVLAGASLSARWARAGAFVIVASAAPPVNEYPTVGLPELVVIGRRWSLNTAIRRSPDDTQPYIVMTHDEIAQTGAISVEQLLRDHLTVDNSAITADQLLNARGQGISAVNLRGLGTNQTLILIDGRRVPGVSNVFDAQEGVIGQTQLEGIPVDAIERVEVLASSASGIYGSNASGGVINIILRRDNRGLQMSATAGGTFDGGGAYHRFDVSGGTQLEDGRTSLSFSASYTHSDPLLLGQRDFLREGREHILSVNPDFFATPGLGLGRTFLAALPNIQSADGSNLVLKNGVSLGSPITSLSPGYSAAQGVAPLIANAGRYNLAIAPTADGVGAPLLLGVRTVAGTFAVEHEFSSWLRAYISALGYDARTTAPGSNVPSTFTLAPTAPNNPFRQSILVTAPQVGGDGYSRSGEKVYSVTAGATVKLPYRWQANLDLTTGRSIYSNTDSNGPITPATTRGILSGALDVLQDLQKFPISYSYASIPTQLTPSRSTGHTVALRFAGTVPLKLPGGKPVVTLLIQHDVIRFDALKAYINAASITAPPSGVTDAAALTLAQVTDAESSFINYYAGRSQTTDSAYAEMRLPIISRTNRVPFVESLELQIAARYDRYDVRAQEFLLAGFSTIQATCGLAKGELTATQLAAPCPPPSLATKSGRSVRGAFNPSVSAKWQVTRDLAFRASYATGFVPPLLNELAPSAPLTINTGLASRLGFHLFSAMDPLRGNELLGSTTPTVTLINGGNPNIDPETSASYSAGLILTPRWLAGVRFSADWTHIDQKQNYFDPSILLIGPAGTTLGPSFAAFLRSHPDRFVRGPPSGGYAVGPIVAIDATLANATGASTDALDLAFDYQHAFPGKGTLSITANATFLDNLSYQFAPGVTPLQLAGVLNFGFLIGGSDYGGVRVKGNATVRWQTDKWSVGARSTYYDSYHFDVDHNFMPPGQGASSVPAQVYFDIFGSYNLQNNSEIQLVVNNLLNKAPLIDVTTSGYYSHLADPRKGSYYVSFVKRF